MERARQLEELDEETLLERLTASCEEVVSVRVPRDVAELGPAIDSLPAS